MGPPSRSPLSYLISHVTVLLLLLSGEIAAEQPEVSIETTEAYIRLSTWTGPLPTASPQSLQGIAPAESRNVQPQDLEPGIRRTEVKKSTRGENQMPGACPGLCVASRISDHCEAALDKTGLCKAGLRCCVSHNLFAGQEFVPKEFVILKGPDSSEKAATLAPKYDHSKNIEEMKMNDAPSAESARRPLAEIPDGKRCKGTCVAAFFSFLCDEVDKNAFCPRSGRCCLTKRKTGSNKIRPPRPEINQPSLLRQTKAPETTTPTTTTTASTTTTTKRPTTAATVATSTLPQQTSPKVTTTSTPETQRTEPTTQTTSTQATTSKPIETTTEKRVTICPGTCIPVAKIMLCRKPSVIITHSDCQEQSICCDDRIAQELWKKKQEAAKRRPIQKQNDNTERSEDTATIPVTPKIRTRPKPRPKPQSSVMSSLMPHAIQSLATYFMGSGQNNKPRQPIRRKQQVLPQTTPRPTTTTTTLAPTTTTAKPTCPGTCILPILSFTCFGNAELTEIFHCDRSGQKCCAPKSAIRDIERQETISNSRRNFTVPELGQNLFNNRPETNVANFGQMQPGPLGPEATVYGQNFDRRPLQPAPAPSGTVPSNYYGKEHQIYNAYNTELANNGFNGYDQRLHYQHHGQNYPYHNQYMNQQGQYPTSTAYPTNYNQQYYYQNNYQQTNPSNNNRRNQLSSNEYNNLHSQPQVPNVISNSPQDKHNPPTQNFNEVRVPGNSHHETNIPVPPNNYPNRPDANPPFEHHVHNPSENLEHSGNQYGRTKENKNEEIPLNIQTYTTIAPITRTPKPQTQPAYIKSIKPYRRRTTSRPIRRNPERPVVNKQHQLKPQFSTTERSYQQTTSGYLPMQNASVSSSSRYECGIKGNQDRRGRVVGGEDASAGEWCWQVALINSHNQYLCGGALIGTQWVLTAAHCVTNIVRSGDSIYVRIGDHDLTTRFGSPGAQTLRVATTYIHHNHNSQTLDNDIALLKLASHAELKKGVCLVCLPARGVSQVAGKRCTVTGYGYMGETGPIPLRIREAEVPIVSEAECVRKVNAVTEKIFILPASSFCAGGESGHDACQGDGGGPLVCAVDGYYEVSGLVSWGFGCGRQEVPGVYVKVASFIGWINQIISVNNHS